MNEESRKYLANKLRKMARKREVKNKFKKLNNWKVFRANINKEKDSNGAL